MEGILALVCIFIVALQGIETQAAALPHPHRHHRLRLLQDAIDRLELRQKTDHILIGNLQKALLEAGEGGKGQDKEDMSYLKTEMEEVKKGVNLVLQEERRDQEFLEMRQELAALRSEVKHLKEFKEAEREKIAAHSHSQEEREAVARAWVVENVRRLQEAVVELQQAFNVTTALHDKQEVESRLVVVSRDLGALRGSMAAVTSKAEAATATVMTLQEEFTRTSKESHRTAGKLAALEVEVSGIREDFNNLLAALPDGIVAEGYKKQLENIGKVISSRTTGRGDVGRKLKPGEAQRQLETRMEAVETGVSEIQASSVQLLATIEALETRVERDVSEVRQEVAKLEYRTGATQDNT